MSHPCPNCFCRCLLFVFTFSFALFVSVPPSLVAFLIAFFIVVVVGCCFCCQDYLIKQENARLGLTHHTGLALATEDILRFAGLNPSSAALSSASLDKRPSCVNKSLSQFPSGLTLRNRYLGEVTWRSFLHLLLFLTLVRCCRYLLVLSLSLFFFCAVVVVYGFHSYCCCRSKRFSVVAVVVLSCLLLSLSLLLVHSLLFFCCVCSSIFFLPLLLSLL